MRVTHRISTELNQPHLKLFVFSILRGVTNKPIEGKKEKKSLMYLHQANGRKYAANGLLRVVACN